ncbi:MAG: NAD-dependent epimerase/dehydratase family protein [Candidatus Shapirobacteria bacterium]|nr:NAD-dependent epimerase/dehydratase family protein [Candidatus Shapirobacteria bacterium]
MKVLVTGQSGLIGSHLVDILLAYNHEVYGISRTNRNKNPRCHNFCLDLRDTARAKKIIESVAPEVVFALAANAAEGKSFFSPIDITTNNIDVFFNTLVPSIRAGKLKRVIFSSSVAVYGSIKTPFKESDTPAPQDIYGVSKLTIENSLKIMSQVHGFEYVIIRPHNVFGPRQNMNDPYRNVVTLFMNHILIGEPYFIYGNGEMRRCFSYVKDVVDIIYRSGFEKVSGMTFNVGSDLDWSINQLSEVIQKISGHIVSPKYLPDRVQEVHNVISNHNLIRKIFGYKDTPLEKALKETWEWAKKQGPQKYIYTELELPNKLVPKNWK